MTAANVAQASPHRIMPDAQASPQRIMPDAEASPFHILLDESPPYLTTEEILALASWVLAQEKVPAASELSISFVDAQEIQSLNAAYRGVDAPTDILSFEMDGAEEIQTHEQANGQAHGQVRFLLGDILICAAELSKSALANQVDEPNMLRILLIHGILHLLGYDHLEAAEAERMEAREDELLAGYLSGYLTESNTGESAVQ